MGSKVMLFHVSMKYITFDPGVIILYKEKMDWEKLLSSKTQILREKGPSSWEAYPVDAFEKDYREIINSELFRNLQDKTQLFPLVRRGYVRTRLTHSLEVSSICKQLGTMIACNKKNEEYAVDFGEKSQLYARNFSTVLSSAGLLHDLGNPPFGHFGESSIGYWFRQSLENDAFTFKGKLIRDVLNEQMKQDLINFEGNAQAFRILLKAEKLPDHGELNITYATINTLIKYPVASTQSDNDSADVRLHKFGYFLADKAKFEEIRREVGLEGHVRYPLTYLLEAADDIAYMISDMEDSIRMKLCTIDEVITFFEQELEQIPEVGDEFHELQQMATMEVLNNLKKRLKGKLDEEDRMYAFRGWLEYVKNWLIYAAAFAFFKNYTQIMEGTYKGELLEDGWYVFTANSFKGVMKKFTFPRQEMLELELSGQKIISSLLDKFIPAVLYWDAEEKGYQMGKVEKKYLWFIPQKYKDDYMKSRTGDEAFDLYLRFLMVVDYISGMSDMDAKTTYQALNGF